MTRLQSSSFLGLHGSYVEPVGNLVRLHTLDISEILEPLHRDTPLPLHLFGPFLHEATHHWCFLGNVGRALAALQFLSAEAALRHLSKQPVGDRIPDPADYERLVACNIKFNTCLKYLRPLAEAMALIAEHDALPFSTRVLFYPLVSTWAAFFLDNRMVVESKHREWIRDASQIISNLRIQPDYFERYANLHCQSFTVNGGAYLLGYESARTLLGILYEQCPAVFRDATFFLVFLRYFFFDDLELVKLLVCETRAERAFEEIDNYFQTRFEKLQRLPAPPAMADLEKQIFAIQNHKSTEFPRYISSKEDEDKASELMWPIVKRLRLDWNRYGAIRTSSVPETTLESIESRILARRSMMCLGDVQAEFHVNGGNNKLVCVLPNGHAIELPLIDSISDPKSLNGRVTLYHSIFAYQVIVASMKSKVVALEATKYTPQDVCSQVVSLHGDYDEQVKDVEILYELVSDAIERAPETAKLSILENHTIKPSLTSLIALAETSASCQAEKLYRDIAWHYIRPEYRDEIMSRMKHDGHLGFLDDNADRLRQKALLRFCETHGVMDYAPIFDSYGYDHREVLSFFSKHEILPGVKNGLVACSGLPDT